jgi:MerR family copper efflux transcriptional regulator
MSRGIQIGKLARETGLTVDAIRFYEKQQLLKPAARSEGGFRLFSEQDIERIQFIRRAQQLGFSLGEIRELLLLQGERVEACSHVRDMLASKLGVVRQRILELRKMESQLAADLKRCERRLRACVENHEPCPVLKEIAKPASGKEGAMKIEVLYFEGCPNHKPAVARVLSVMREQGIAAMVAEVEIRDAEAAKGGALSRFSHHSRERR